MIKDDLRSEYAAHGLIRGIGLRDGWRGREPPTAVTFVQFRTKPRRRCDIMRSTRVNRKWYAVVGGYEVMAEVGISRKDGELELSGLEHTVMKFDPT